MQLCCVRRQQLWLRMVSMQLRLLSSNRHCSTDQITLKDMRCVRRHAAASLDVLSHLQVLYQSQAKVVPRRCSALYQANFTLPQFVKHFTLFKLVRGLVLCSVTIPTAVDICAGN